MKVEVLCADHQNKPDVGSNIVRQWYRRRQGRRDRRRADVLGRACGQPDRRRQEQGVPRVGRGGLRPHRQGTCSPNTVHWTYDTWALANGTGKAIVQTGGETWFFLTADYAFGHALERDAAGGGRGERQQGSRQRPHPLPGHRTSPRSCCRRRPPRPRSSGSPTPAATPSTRSSRRPSSASSRAARTLPACLVFITDVHALGLRDRAGADLHGKLLLGSQRRRAAPSPSGLQAASQGHACPRWCRPASTRRSRTISRRWRRCRRLRRRQRRSLPK